MKKDEKDEIEFWIAATLSLFTTIAFVVWAFIAAKDGGQRWSRCFLCGSFPSCIPANMVSFVHDIRTINCFFEKLLKILK